METIDTIWPVGEDPDKVEENLQQVQQCGAWDDQLSEQDFWNCKEYTCGLWQSFHAMSVQEDAHPGEDGAPVFTGADMMTTLKGFISNFFMCDVCRTHFMQVMQREEVGPSKQKTFQVQSQKDFALWLWEAHNVVNVRLGKEEEESGDADPDRPKEIYPNFEACDVCKVDVKSKNYSVEHVYEYLVIHYTNHLRLPQKKTESIASSDETERMTRRERERIEAEEADRERRRLKREAYARHKEESGTMRVLLSVLLIVVCCLGFAAAVFIYDKKQVLQHKSYKKFNGYVD